MFATGVYKGRTVKTVTIAGVHDETREEIIDLALEVARETRADLFGIRVTQSQIDPHSFEVALNTD
jgi:hypothetical protein